MGDYHLANAIQMVIRNANFIPVTGQDWEEFVTRLPLMRIMLYEAICRGLEPNFHASLSDWADGYEPDYSDMDDLVPVDRI
jgi:hypothetical protein